MAFGGRLVPLTMRNNFWADSFFSPMWLDFEEMTRDFDRGLGALGARSHCGTCRCDGEDRAAKQEASRSVELRPPMRQLLRFFEDDPFKGQMKWVDDQVMKVKDDDKSFEVSIAAHDYTPGEIKVTVQEDRNMMRVEGHHEEKAEDGSKYAKRHFIRQYTLPKECQPQKVESHLSSDGVLMIRAPKVEQPKAVQGPREVPIQQD